jgi:hypothetical protein
MKRLTGPILALLAMPFLTAAVILPEWQQQLESQLKKEQSCDVIGLSSVKLRLINGKQSTSARAHCSDKRSFDVTRDEPGQPYKIRECSTTAC